MIRAVTFVLATAATIHAACDNQCSGHGTCQIDDVCNCYDNWGVGLSLDTGDCSDRICPFELAWVDQPTEHGNHHRYAECSGRGICDRTSGVCECFDGYEGNGCKRASCPNDCSGHGTCEYIEDLAYGVVWNQYQALDFKDVSKTFDYHGWDKGKQRACVCDAQYADVDCSKRMCPYGTDVLAVRENLLLEEKSQIQEIWFATEESVDPRDMQTQTFALRFTSKMNESFTTVPINFDYLNEDNIYDFMNDVKLALLQLPNQVIDGVNVKFSNKWRIATAGPYSGGFNYGLVNRSSHRVGIQIEFTGDAVQGKQNLLEVIDYKCGDGCTPKVSGLVNLAVAVAHVDKYSMLNSSVAEYQESDLNSYECGRRGKCDYDTGLCACFEGYTGESCNMQTTLV